MARLAIRHLSVCFAGGTGERVRALEEISLTVEDGEIVTVLGPSGAGKSTLLRAVAGLEENARGEIQLGSDAIQGWAPEKRDVAMVLQNPALYPHMTVRENLAFPLMLRKTPSAERAARIGQAADLLGISKLLDRLPGTLSGGEGQRVAIGRAIVRNPKLFLFDEPLSSLDLRLRQQVRSELRELQRRLHATFLYVTHDQQEAMSLGARVVVLKEGRVEQIATPGELYRCPRTSFVAGFIGEPSMNLLPVRLDKERGLLLLETEPGGRDEPEAARMIIPQTVRPDWGSDLLLGIRPEDLQIATGEQIDFEQTCEARIEQIEFAGFETHVQVRIGSRLLWSRAGAEFQAEAGKRVRLEFRWDRAHWFDRRTGERVAFSTTR